MIVEKRYGVWNHRLKLWVRKGGKAVTFPDLAGANRYIRETLNNNQDCHPMFYEWLPKGAE